jgi:NADP-dependent 3-hydroxy acid dehydrogenase YdfG
LDAVVESYGRVDVIINNAGLVPHSPLERLKVDGWERMIDVNIKGVLYGIAAVYSATRHAMRVIYLLATRTPLLLERN